ncbi:hypothetical protein [Marinobacter sp.]|uniref:hypothetical protein n=1 Tax=Marinobacter sp. TaxID=50741 RepID=UPI003A93147F
MKKSTLSPELKKKIDNKRHWRTIRHTKAHEEARLQRRREKRYRGQRSQWAFEVKAPSNISLYHPRDHERTVSFLEELRKSFSRYGRIRLCFQDTKQITAAGGLLFIAEIDRLCTHYPAVKVDCTHPPRRLNGKFKNESYLIESVLNQIGFFKLIGKAERNVPSYPNVSCWRLSQGRVAEGSIAGALINQVDGKLPPIAKQRLYRGAIEAISNCVDHAYPTMRPDGLNISDDRWWMFVGISAGKLIVIVCDLGVGIPSTVPKNYSKASVRAVLEFLNISKPTDSGLIHASTYLSKTRTKMKHRGKGGKDIRELLDHYAGAALVIYSNKGCFKDGNKMTRSGTKHAVALKDEQKKSIKGTVIEWTIPVGELSL